MTCTCQNPFDGRITMPVGHGGVWRDCCLLRHLADMPLATIRQERKKYSDADWLELRPKIQAMRLKLFNEIQLSRKNKK